MPQEEAKAHDEKQPTLPGSDPPKIAKLPAAKRPPKFSDATDELRASPVFGAPPPTTTHWMCKKFVGGEFKDMLWAPPGSHVELREWPLAELSAEEISKRWGAGLYRLKWAASQERGGFRVLRGERDFKIREDVPAPAPASASGAPVANPAPDVFGAMGPALQLVKLIDQSSDAKLAGVAQMAQLFAGQAGGRGGLGAAELELILRNQAEANQRAIASAVAAAVEPLQREIASLSGEGDEDEDEDDEGAGAAGPAGQALAAVAPLIKGKGKFAGVMNFAAANPALAQTFLEKGLPVISELGSKLLALLTPAAPPAPPAPALPVATAPRAPVATVAEVAAPPPPRVPSASSLSDWRPAAGTSTIDARPNGGAGA